MAYRLFAPILLRESSSRIRIVSNTISPGRTASGITPMIVSDGGGLWMIEYQGINLRTVAQIQTYRAIMAGMDGGATPIVVPICDKRYAPFPTVGGVKVYTVDAVPHDDNTTHDDGTGYADNVVHAEIAADADLRDTTLQIQAINMAALQGGELFSLNHPTMLDRLYQVVSVDSVVGAISTVTIRPPLRDMVTAGTMIEFDQPRLTAQLASPDSGALELQLRQFGSASPTFIEAFPPVG